MQHRLRFVFISGSLVIAVLLLAAYSNSFRVPFQFDGVNRIQGSLEIRTTNPFELFQNFKSRFIPYYTFAANYALGRDQVWGYHLVNLLIHMAASMLAGFLAFLTLSTPYLRTSFLAKHAALLSVFTGLIFALHPLQTESVTYIYQRSELLAGFFYLLALTGYAGFRLMPITDRFKRKRRLSKTLVIIAILLCSFSKPTSATLSLGILFYEVAFLSTNRKELRKQLKFILITFLLVIIPILLTASDPSELSDRPELHEAGDVSIRLTPDAIPYYLTKLRALTKAFRLLVVPYPQTLEYHFAWSESLWKPLTTLGSFVFLSLFGLAGILMRHRSRLISFFVGWFFLTQMVTSLFVMGDLFFEHFLYLTVFGWALILPCAVVWIARRADLHKKIWVITLSVIILTYGLASFQRNHIWRSEISLWEDAVRKAPLKVRPHYILGVYYFRDNRLDDAFAEYKTALQLKPNYAPIHFRLGEYYARKEMWPLAVSSYSAAVLFDPAHFDSHLNLGVLYFDLGRRDRAEHHLRKAARYARVRAEKARLEDMSAKLRSKDPSFSL